MQIAAPSVIGTHSTDSAPPYTHPDTANASRAMLLLNAMSTNPNWGELPFEINFDVSPNLSTQLANPNTQKAAIQNNVLVNPTGGGNCSTVTCPSIWAQNNDLRVRGSQGQVALALNVEFDYNNQYGGTDAFQPVNWIAYGGDFPVLAGEYYSNQFTDTYTGSATVSGQNVTLTSGTFTARLASGIYLGGTGSANFYHVDGATDATHIHVSAVPPQGSTTYQWSPAGQTYGILMTDNGPSAPLTQSTDILLNTSGYDALQIGGNHVVSISTTNDAASTALSLRGNSNGAGQQICFDSFDGCQLDYGGSGRHLFLAAGGQTFEIDAVGAGTTYAVVTNAADNGVETPSAAFAKFGPTISVNGGAFDDLNFVADGANASIHMLSMLKLKNYGIAQLPPCQNDTDGDVAYIYDGNGGGAPTFHGQVTAATSGQTPALINSPAYCDGGVWRYL